MPRIKPPHYSFYGQTPISGPDWRWQRAVQLVEMNKNRSLERDGPEIYRAIGFVRKMKNDRTGNGTKQLLRDDPNLVMATKFANEGGRPELELRCRVLAGESLAAAAVEVGLALPVASTYCTFFFDVLDRREQISYIRHRVCQVPINGPAPVESLAKLSCFNHGPSAVPCWLDYLNNMGSAHDLTTTVGRQRESIELYISAMNLSLDETTGSSFLKRAAYIMGIKEKMYHDRPASELFSLTASKMLTDSVRWKTKTDDFATTQAEVATQKPLDSIKLGQQATPDMDLAAV